MSNVEFAALHTMVYFALSNILLGRVITLYKTMLIKIGVEKEKNDYRDD